MLMERMLPATLADDSQERQLARMHVRVAVVRLVRILRRVVRVHIIRHRATVDHEVRGNVRLGRDAQTTSRSASRAGPSCQDLLFCRAMNPGIYLGELE